jgi:hypothetical protein
MGCNDAASSRFIASIIIPDYSVIGQYSIELLPKNTSIFAFSTPNTHNYQYRALLNPLLEVEQILC